VAELTRQAKHFQDEKKSLETELASQRSLLAQAKRDFDDRLAALRREPEPKAEEVTDFERATKTVVEGIAAKTAEIDQRIADLDRQKFELKTLISGLESQRAKAVRNSSPDDEPLLAALDELRLRCIAVEQVLAILKEQKQALEAQRE
jgi:hypothetical protein